MHARRLIYAAIILLLLAASPRGAEAQRPVLSAELAYRSDYLFSGIPFASGPVTQATLTMASGSISLNGFASYDHDLSEINEADIYGDFYSQLSPGVGAFVGLGLYNFKLEEGWDMTPELYAGIVLTAPLTPTVMVAHDFDLGDGTHVLLTLSESVPLGGSPVSLDLEGNLDYNSGYYVEGSEFSYADVGASLSIPVGALTLRPIALVQIGIADAFVDEEVFGVSASIVF